MARMTSRKRRSLSSRDFAGPGRSFPINDARHAEAALSGATRSYHAGNITKTEMRSIQRKARSKLRHSRRGAKR